MQDDGKQETATLSAREVIERFGGIRPAAKAIGVAFTTVQGWKERDHIPEHRWTELRAAAAEQGIDLSEVTGSPALKEAKTEEVVTVSMDEPSVAPAADSAGKEKQAEPASGAAGSDGKVENADAPAEEKSDSSPWSEQTSPKPDDAAEAEQETSEPDDTEKKPRYVFWTLFVLALMLGTAIATWPRWNHLAKPYIESYVPPLAGILYRTKDPAPVTPAPTPAPAAEAPADPAAVAPESAKAPASQSNQPAVSDSIREAVAPLQEALRQATDRIAELEQRPLPGESGDTVDVTPLVERITALETASAPTGADPAILGRLAEIEEAIANVRGADPETVSAISSNLTTVAAKAEAMSQEIAQLQQALQDLRAARQSQASEGTSLALAVNQLAQAVNRRGSYQPALQTVTALAGDSPAAAAALADLQAFAEGGAPDLASLRSAFPVMASDVMKAIALADNTDWMSSALGRVKSLVSIRRVGEEVSGDDPEALLAQAEVALDAGDLPEAARLIGQLPPAGLEAADSWLDKAKGRIAVMSAIDALQAQAIGALAQ
ncbi:MAG: mitofilin family membrane protein [Rhodospirillales bacterium]